MDFDFSVVGAGMDDETKEDPAVNVELNFNRIVCARHAEPFRSGWPDGFPGFTMAIFEEMTRDDTFSNVVGRSTALIHEALDRAPICERITKHSLFGALTLSGVGTMGICELCEQTALGTPYGLRTGPVGGLQFAHLCFSCVVYQIQPLN